MAASIASFIRKQAPLYMTAAVLCFVLVQSDISAIVAKLRGISYTGMVMAVMCIAVSQIISAARLRYYAGTYHANVPIPDARRIYFKGIFLNICLPGGIGGDAYKCLVLHRDYAVTGADTLRCALAERASGLLALLMTGIFCAGVAFSTHTNQPRLLTTLICCTASTLLWLYYRISVRHFTRETRSTSLGALYYSLPVQLLQFSAFFTCAASLPGTVDIGLYGSLFALSAVAAILPLSVGGLGVREAIFFYGAAWLPAIDQEHAVASAGLFFLCGLPCACAGAFLRKKDAR